MKRLTIRCLLVVIHVVALQPSAAGDAPAYVSEVRPILQTRCLSCHNPEKQKGGLDMTSYQGVLAGGSGGKIVLPGDPGASPMLGVIEQTREPRMPPSGNKLSDDEIRVIREWIQHGCRETSAGPAAPAVEKPVIQPLEATAIGTTLSELPLAWPLSDIVEAERSDAVTSLAAHPGAPVIALAAQQQILIYHITTGKLIGALPTRPAFPLQVRFSTNGRLLVAAGGVAAASGFVRAWNVGDGRLALDIEHASESVRTADIDAEQRWCAFGGPSGVVFVQELSSGEIVHRFTKHTDWITDVQYSPDGLLLATADRAGGLFVWEAESRNLMHSLPTHPGAITSIAWRADSNLLATACEDGQIRLYEPEGGAGVKGWTAHAGGALCVRWSADGQLVSAGRDRLARRWKPDFSAANSMPAFDDIALACDFAAGARFVAASDFNGIVRVFDAETSQEVGQLNGNPPPFAQQLAMATQRHAHASEAVDAARQQRDSAKAAFDEASAKLQQSSRAMTAESIELKRLRAAEKRAELDAIAGELVEAKRVHQPIHENARSAEQKVAEATETLAKARAELDSLDQSIETNAKALESTNLLLSSLNANRTALEKQIKDNKAALQYLSSAVVAIEEQMAAFPDAGNLAQTLAHATQAKSLMETEIINLETGLAKIGTDISTATNTLAVATSQASATREQREALALRIVELESVLVQTKETAASVNAEAMKALDAEAAIESRLAAVMAEYQAMIADVAASLASSD